MLNLGIFITVVLTSLVASYHGSPTHPQSKDIENILELLKSEKSEDLINQFENTKSDSSSDENSNNSVDGLLKNMEVIDLIRHANQDKITSKSQDRYEKEKSNNKHSNNPVYRNYEMNRLKDTQKILEQLLHQNLKQVTHQRVKPNHLLPTIRLEEDDETQMDGLNEYSKIFVILDPLAVRKSKNKGALTNLISRILSLSSPSNGKARQERNKSHLYKGFKVKNDIFSRRYSRDSTEGYGGRDSMEEEKNQKRSRNDRGGGGGGGRTAIPYIGQRGDIYERDS